MYLTKLLKVVGKVLDKNKTIKNFEAKGFQKYESKSNDHLWLEFWHEGKMTIHRTKFSHGSGKDLNDFIISAISKQVSMTKPFLMEFAQCKKSQNEYIEQLKKAGKL